MDKQNVVYTYNARFSSVQLLSRVRLCDPMNCSTPGLPAAAAAAAAKPLQSCLTLCDPMDCSLPGSSIHGILQARELEWGAIAFSPGFPVHHQLPECTQTPKVYSHAIQPSHPLSSAFPPTLNLSQHQGCFKSVSSSHQVAKVLEFQLQH